jgi:YVTN family beta-propeller protein
LKRMPVFLVLMSLLFSFPYSSPANTMGVTEPSSVNTGAAVHTLETPVPRLQGMGPTVIANSEDGKYAYVGFHLSETIAKIRLSDLTITAMADLSQYFPLQCYRMVLDASGEKLFVHSAAWRKLIVLDTQTLGVIQTINEIDATGMLRSQDGRLMIWDGGNTVMFVNTGTYAVTEFTDPAVGFLQIQESPSDPDIWYVITQLGPGLPWTIGSYDSVAKAWIKSVEIPQEGDTPGIWDFKVLPDESKLYAAGVGGNYPQEYHSYGWVYSIDLVNWDVKKIPVEDGGAASLETSPDSQQVYVGTNEPLPNDRYNILVIDTHSDTLLDPIDLGRTKYNWAHGEIRDLQLDLANPQFLYAVSNDANAFVKVDLNRSPLTGEIVFNQEDLSPHFFARRPGQSSGYVLVPQKPYGFELDLDSAEIKNVVRFPSIRADSGAYDVAVTNAGRLLIAQGEQVLEVDGLDLHLIANHPLAADVPSLWHFVLSRDQGTLYGITKGLLSSRPDTFLAIKTADFQAQANFTLTGGAFDYRPFELPDGSKLYALGGEDFGTTLVDVIGTKDYTIQKTITYDEPGLRGQSGGPYYPYAYDSIGHTLYVGATYVVMAIDTETDEITKVINLEDVAGAIGLEPQQFIYVNAIGLVYQPEENYLYIAHLDRSFISIYDLTNDQFLPQVIPLKGFFPYYVMANDDVSKIYVINMRSDNISVIDVNSKAVEKLIDLVSYLQVVYLPNVFK